MPLDLEELEKILRDIGQRIQSGLPDHVGFALLIFDFGEGGHMTYLSNAARDDMLKAMSEFMQRQGH